MQYKFSSLAQLLSSLVREALGLLSNNRQSCLSAVRVSCAKYSSRDTMPCNLIPVHGLLELQPKFIATGVADVPFIFLYVTQSETQSCAYMVH